MRAKRPYDGVEDDSVTFNKLSRRLLMYVRLWLFSRIQERFIREEIKYCGSALALESETDSRIEGTFKENAKQPLEIGMYGQICKGTSDIDFSESIALAS